MIFITKMFSLCFMCICFLYAFCVGLYVLTCSKFFFYFTKIIIIISDSEYFLSSLPKCPHSQTPVRILLNVRWQNEAELGRVTCWKSAKAENPMRWYFFIFSICRFLSVLKCLLSMFWEVVMKKKWNRYI